jgi:hypothetical protein
MLVMVLVLGAVGSAGASVEEPEILDPCGVGAHSVDQQPLPWLDICAGWFDVEILDEVPELTVTLQVASDLGTRTDGTWRMGWRSGECGFQLERHDHGGGDVTDLGPKPAVELLVRCEPARRVDCDPPQLEDLGFFCVHIPEDQRFDVTDGYAEDGDRLTWRVRFDGELADYAHLHEPGAVLTATSAQTATNISGAMLSLNSCQRGADDPWRCRSQVGDWVPEGRDHVVTG